MKTKLLLATLLCGLVAACSDPEPELTPDQKEVVELIETFGEAQGKEDYDKAWDLLSAGRQEIYRIELMRPVSGARDTVAGLRPILEPESLADAAEKERVKGILAKYPPWEQLKDMTPKQYYAWHMKNNATEASKKEAPAFYHRMNIKDWVFEKNTAYVEWEPKEAKRTYFIKEGGKWKIGLAPKEQRDYEASKTNSEKR